MRGGVGLVVALDFGGGLHLAAQVQHLHDVVTGLDFSFQFAFGFEDGDCVTEVVILERFLDQREEDLIVMCFCRKRLCVVLQLVRFEFGNDLIPKLGF